MNDNGDVALGILVVVFVAGWIFSLVEVNKMMDDINVPGSLIEPVARGK